MDKRPAGTRDVTYADRSTDNAVEGADPRFGMDAPLTTSTTFTTAATGGHTLSTITDSPQVTWNQSNIAEVSTLTETTKVNTRSYVAAYVETPAKKWTFTSPELRQETLTLDAAGRPQTYSVPSSTLNDLTLGYNTNGQLATITHGTGPSARVYAVDYNGTPWPHTVTDPEGRVTTFSRDSAGRPQSVALPGGRTVSFSYDGSGNVTSVTPPGRPAHEFWYTPVNLEEQYSPPQVPGAADGTRSTFNLDRQLTSVLRPGEAQVNLDYDTAGRLSHVYLPRGTTQLGYATDTGQLSTVSAAGVGTLTYGYEGPLVTSAAWSGTYFTGSVGYVYDNDLRVATQSVTGTTTTNVSFGFDGDGWLTSAGGLSITGRTPYGFVTETTLGGATTSATPNAFGELQDYTVTVSGQEKYVEHVTSRDKLGRITARTETVLGTTASWSYEYNPAGQLWKATKDGTTVEYTFDSNGNRSDCTTDAQDRLLTCGGTTYEYTPAGDLLHRITGGQTTTFHYDPDGALTQVDLPGAGSITYDLDGHGRRVGRHYNGTAVYWLYDEASRPVAELDQTGAVTMRFVYASGANVPSYIVSGGTSYLVVTDHLGSVRVVFDPTTGARVQQLDARRKIEPHFRPPGE